MEAVDTFSGMDLRPDFTTPLQYAAYLATYISSPIKIEGLVKYQFGRAPALHRIAEIRYQIEQRAKCEGGSKANYRTIRYSGGIATMKDRRRREDDVPVEIREDSEFHTIRANFIADTLAAVKRVCGVNKVEWDVASPTMRVAYYTAMHSLTEQGYRRNYIVSLFSTRAKAQAALNYERINLTPEERKSITENIETVLQEVRQTEADMIEAELAKDSGNTGSQQLLESVAEACGLTVDGMLSTNRDYVPVSARRLCYYALTRNGVDVERAARLMKRTKNSLSGMESAWEREGTPEMRILAARFVR